MNPNTGIPYFCGYVNDEKLKATVWENNETLYSHDLSYVTESSASYISIDNDSIFTLGYHEAYDYDLPVIWKNGNAIKTFDEDVMVKCLCAFQGDYYYCYTYPHEMDYCLCSNNSIVLQFPFDGSAGANKICKNDDDIYVVGLLDNKGCIWKNFEVFQQLENCDQLFDIVVFERFIEDHSEWYYEIQNDDGTITYQHLYCAGDTVVQGKRPKVIVRSNTQYDKAEHTDVTHEYVYEENGMVYWWNKDLEEFTTLYNLNAEIGDEWEIKVGNESITMHVEGVDSIEYEGRLFRVLHVSDSDDLFSGDIVCGIGHLTSFFPERLMNHNKDYRI